MKTYIAFEIGGETFKWLVPENMNLVQGLTKVFEANVSKINAVEAKNNNSLIEMYDAISMLDGEDSFKETL